VAAIPPQIDIVRQRREDLLGRREKFGFLTDIQTERGGWFGHARCLLQVLTKVMEAVGPLRLKRRHPAVDRVPKADGIEVVPSFPATPLDRYQAASIEHVGTQFEDSITAVKLMKQHGLDLADLSLGFNTDEMTNAPFNDVGFMVSRANQVRREVGIPVAASWNLGVPQNADRVIRQELVDLVFLGRPALSNPHWPIWAARELAHEDPFHLVPSDWAWWLRNFRGHGPSIGWPDANVAPDMAERPMAAE